MGSIFPRDMQSFRNLKKGKRRNLDAIVKTEKTDRMLLLQRKIRILGRCS